MIIIHAYCIRNLNLLVSYNSLQDCSIRVICIYYILGLEYFVPALL